MNDLQHHGILGQKWGVRRYQNKDGSLTAKGQKHREAESSGPSKRTQKLGKQVSTLQERADTWTGDIKDKKGKTILSEKEVQNVRNAILKKVEKVKIKEIKSRYVDDYLRGKSKVGKILSKLTDGHNTYAEFMYNVDYGNLKNKYKT